MVTEREPGPAVILRKGIGLCHDLLISGGQNCGQPSIFLALMELAIIGGRQTVNRLAAKPKRRTGTYQVATRQEDVNSNSGSMVQSGRLP